MSFIEIACKPFSQRVLSGWQTADRRNSFTSRLILSESSVSGRIESGKVLFLFYRVERNARPSGDARAFSFGMRVPGRSERIEGLDRRGIRMRFARRLARFRSSKSVRIGTGRKWIAAPVGCAQAYRSEVRSFGPGVYVGGFYPGGERIHRALVGTRRSE